MTDSGKYEDYTVDDLRDFLRDRDLPVSGTKDELVARLEDDDQAEATGPAIEHEGVEDTTQIKDADQRRAEVLGARAAEVEDQDTTCEGSGLVIPGSPVPVEQRNPFPCPVCGKNFDLGELDEDATEDVIPEHDDIRLVPEEPDDWRPETND